MNRDELKILQMLDEIIRQKSVKIIIDSIAYQAKRKLNSSISLKMAWKQVPLYIYGAELPEIIKSSWVFIIRSHTNTGAERHPNSHQRMVSYRGLGDLQVRDSKKWCSNFLVSKPEAPIKNKWVSIPAGVWHRAIVSDEDWVVVSFHTVYENELIEERPDSSGMTKTHSRTYL